MTTSSSSTAWSLAAAEGLAGDLQAAGLTVLDLPKCSSVLLVEGDGSRQAGP